MLSRADTVALQWKRDKNDAGTSLSSSSSNLTRGQGPHNHKPQNTSSISFIQPSPTKSLHHRFNNWRIFLPAVLAAQTINTGISSQIGTKLRDWVDGQAGAGCYSWAALSSNDSKTRYTGAHLYEQRRARTKIELTRGVNLHPCISQ